MPEGEIYQTLGQIFSQVFMRDDLRLTPELSAKDVAGWDSFKQIDVILAIEAEYSIKFSTKELDTLFSVGDLVRLIGEKTSRR